MSREGRLLGVPSPSLLNKLRQFRFQKQSGPKLESEEKLTLDLHTRDKNLVACNTTIYERSVENKGMLTTPNVTQNITTKSMGSPDGLKYEWKKNVICIDVSDSEDESIMPSETTVQEVTELNVRATEETDINSKEIGIQFLEDAFPEIDKMVIQDALISNNWNVEETMAQMCRGQVKRSRDSSVENSPPHKKAKRKDVEDIEEEKADDDNEEAANIKGELVFDSDDSDQEFSDELSGDKQKVFEFLSTATVAELRTMLYCTQKKAETIVELRPFLGWRDMVAKFQNGKFVGTDTLNTVQEFLQMRRELDTLMKKCLKIATQMEQAVLAGATSIKKQPSLLSDGLSLAGYQMVGLNWFLVMHDQRLNGILADEMGLGKTIQVIAFLAHLKEVDKREGGLLHLIIVPSSTLENWSIELKRWCPSLKVATYYGSPKERKILRVRWMRKGLDDIDIILTTYNIVNSSPEEKKMFRLLPLEYLVLDEAHMLKNMTTQRYENLSRINAQHRILLTGTPLQNSLLELMSLLIFVMPNMFGGKKDHLKRLFSKIPKQGASENDDNIVVKFEQEQVTQARRIMKPFVLRRLKTEVLKDLPLKTDETIVCALAESQQEKYDELIRTFSESAGQEVSDISGMAMMIQLRKMANHPLLLRYYYNNEQLEEMAAHLAVDPQYKEENKEYIFDDLAIMSDFQLNQLVQSYKCLSGYSLPPSLFLESGKFHKLDEILPDLKLKNHRVLIFSQFVIMLDVLEVYLTARDHQYFRLDGSTPVTSRQELIDSYNHDESIFVFLLSTRAGGMGINLTAADTVIIHDIDFNPYNDKQAEDRCHRVGQSRSVTVTRLISAGTIEEGIYQVAQDKLTLEKEINSTDGNEPTETKNVVCLLKQALGLDSTRATHLTISKQSAS